MEDGRYPEMTTDEFERLRHLIYRQTYLYCPDAQRALFERKIRLRLAALHLAAVPDYVRYLQEAPAREQEMQQLIDMMAIHETSFFRIPGHFSGLQRRIFPALLTSSGPPLRAWSAGCSTGQEPYSIAMAFLAARAAAPTSFAEGRTLHILATDISPRVLEIARLGRYASQKIQKIPQPFLDKYFEHRDDLYYVTAEVKHLVTFEMFNLTQLSDLPAARMYDLIFCRNILIYCDRTAQQALMTGIVRRLAAGGLLFLGDAESLHLFPEVARAFEMIESDDAIIYQKRGVQSP